LAHSPVSGQVVDQVAADHEEWNAVEVEVQDGLEQML
jgi:hypothetical protein